ncbi:MAG: serine/threonine protein kinase [Polyangiaceae bacterium]|nr:serine/threonine protein kinase [Polyangiaceae bacterium]
MSVEEEDDFEGELRPGTVVGGYRIVGLLGAGGSGSVYRAQKVGMQLVVALKVMNAEHLDSDSEKQRFAREAEVVKRLEHPHVVRLIDYGHEGALPFLVFPLLEGRTLEQRLRAEGPLDYATTGRFAAQVLSALDKAHGMDIAHRDIKPANIYLCRTPIGEIVQILDFGTAKIAHNPNERMDVTRAGALVGTPRYMAPEQVRSEAVGPPADVYAFGLVMAEMLLGHPLVQGGKELDLFVAQGSDRPHVLPDAIKTSPFAAVIERAVAKPLEVRYRLASQMLADVNAINARLGAGAADPGEADLEATQFVGQMNPFAAAKPNEQAMRLRQAFNKIADKAPPSSTRPTPAAQPGPTSTRPSQPQAGAQPQAQGAQRAHAQQQAYAQQQQAYAQQQQAYAQQQQAYAQQQAYVQQQQAYAQQQLQGQPAAAAPAVAAQGSQAQAPASGRPQPPVPPQRSGPPAAPARASAPGAPPRASSPGPAPSPAAGPALDAAPASQRGLMVSGGANFAAQAVVAAPIASRAPVGGGSAEPRGIIVNQPATAPAPVASAQPESIVPGASVPGSAAGPSSSDAAAHAAFSAATLQVTGGGRSGSMVLWIVLGALVVLGGGGAAAYFLLLR